MVNPERRHGRKNRKHGRNKRKPAKQRYWAEGRLEEHKVRNLVRHNGMTEEQARKFWRAVRTKRMKRTTRTDTP
jgi:hypothetical protein